VDETVLWRRDGVLGSLILDRPQALNALNLGMIRGLQAGFDALRVDARVGVLLLEGAGPRGFCAGGDIRAVHASGRAGDGEAQAFWREEYELIAQLAAAGKPVVALMDGIVMGGGAGLSMHVSHRIVTERTRFAMPEVGIGFLPDVGATHRLPRAPGGFGRYLALTGDVVGPGDVIAAGLADAHVPSSRLDELKSALATMPLPPSRADIASVIAAFSTEPEAGLFVSDGETIRAAFSKGTAASAALALADLAPGDPGASFARRTRDILSTRSPFSLRLTAALLDAGAASQTLETCLTREFRAACRCLAVEDFYEGVRAAVIDKDRTPRWPSARDGIADLDIDQFLSPIPGVADPLFERSARFQTQP
jgi:enoyl-CoA hydratase